MFLFQPSWAFRGQTLLLVFDGIFLTPKNRHDEGDAVPKMAQLALATWRHYAPDYEVP